MAESQDDERHCEAAYMCSSLQALICVTVFKLNLLYLLRVGRTAMLKQNFLFFFIFTVKSVSFSLQATSKWHRSRVTHPRRVSLCQNCDAVSASSLGTLPLRIPEMKDSCGCGLTLLLLVMQLERRDADQAAAFVHMLQLFMEQTEVQSFTTAAVVCVPDITIIVLLFSLLLLASQI